MADVADRLLLAFTAQSLANTAWAFAIACRSDSALFGALVKSAVRHIGDFDSQQVANIAWACTTAGCWSTQLFEALAAAARQLANAFKLQEITNMAWAFQSVGECLLQQDQVAMLKRPEAQDSEL
eukprot:gnl/TRDRNA2_/TRDRNA2_58572_c0_seq1.p1 gnl/TRDRNA2_/TRDRNA2_58572_c0~~gnl/TRDRNA2_/TRDRNA2_58572_c0_seq1.p1  ORF type:complete len:137 (-),score=30.26 gnl/TRDRNA2_/TRDRNA2_58572_c0_seq1:68-442(-)